MHNIIVQLCMLIMALVIAGVKSLDLQPQQLMERAQRNQKDDDPAADVQVTALLHLQQVFQSNLLIVNIFLLALLATAVYSIFQIIAFAFLWLVAVHLLATTKPVKNRATRFARRYMSALLHLATGLQPALKLLDESHFLALKRHSTFYTRGELLEAVMSSKGVLTKAEKDQLQMILNEPADSHMSYTQKK